MEKFFTDSLDVIYHVCERIFWRSTLKVLQSSQVEFLRAEGYDQLEEDEKEVLACINCFNDVSREQLPRYATVNGFFYQPLSNFSKMNVIEEHFVAVLLPFQQIQKITWFAGAKKFVGQAINVPVGQGLLLKVLSLKLSDSFPATSSYTYVYVSKQQVPFYNFLTFSL